MSVCVGSVDDFNTNDSRQPLTVPFTIIRQLDRPIRTKALKERLPSVKVPPAAYLPLCKSTDPWSRVLGLIPEEARAFSTKARCPCLVLVEVERDTVGASGRQAGKLLG